MNLPINLNYRYGPVCTPARTPVPSPIVIKIEPKCANNSASSVLVPSQSSISETKDKFKQKNPPVVKTGIFGRYIIF
jgi:hypothetical protein